MARARPPSSSRGGSALVHVSSERPVDTPPPLRQGLDLSGADGRTIHDRSIVRRLARLAVPPAYEDVLLRRRSGSASAGHRPRRRGPAAISLPSGLGEGARDPQGGAAGAACRCAAAHPPQHRPASFGAGADARNLRSPASSSWSPAAPSGPAAKATRASTARAAPPRCLKSNVTLDGALIRLTFRAKGGKKVVKDVTCPRLSRAIELLRQIPGRRLFQYRAENGSVRPGPGAEVNAVPAPDRRRPYFAEGFPHADGVRERAGGAWRAQRRPRANASAASRCWSRAQPRPKTCTTRRRSAAAATCTTPWWRRSRMACSSGSRKHSPAAARRRRRAQVLAQIIAAAA